MGINLKLPPQASNNHPIAVRYQRRPLLKAFWVGVIVLFLVELYTVDTYSILSIAGAILIGIASLYPFYLWCSGKALGMPVYPLFALTFLWTHALPLVTKHPVIITYSPENHLFASITVTIFLGLGTFTWFQFVKSPPPYPKAYRALREKKGESFFLFILVIGVFFNMYSLGGWFILSGGAFTLIRGAVLGLSILSVFVLSYRLGTRELSRNQAIYFLVALFLLIISSGAGLILRENIVIFSVSTIAFVLGRNQIPIITILIVFVCLSLLHSGKDGMRAKYWFGNQSRLLQPWEYPAWYSEWVGYSFDNFRQDKTQPKTEEKTSSLERSSVIHMLLIAQGKTPSDLPYLYGKTYSILPQLILPRFLNSNKIRSHEGTHILSIYYGLQTEEGTLTTTIGWGLIAEAYANFGLLGCGGVGIILGAALGQATRWSLNTPVLSARSLFNILLVSFASQTEWTAGVYVAALFQSSVTLVGINFVFMKVYRLKGFSSTNQENYLISAE
ncbi:hypothetical protein H6F96_28930 [Microcoleus sp. FACHB-53]|nr:hypothetical protein [Microcoleus sp. FACHB-53]